jgi:hypothetical protein
VTERRLGEGGPITQQIPESLDGLFVGIDDADGEIKNPCIVYFHARQLANMFDSSAGTETGDAIWNAVDPFYHAFITLGDKETPFGEEKYFGASADKNRVPGKSLLTGRPTTWDKSGADWTYKGDGRIVKTTLLEPCGEIEKRLKEVNDGINDSQIPYTNDITDNNKTNNSNAYAYTLLKKVLSDKALLDLEVQMFNPINNPSAISRRRNLPGYGHLLEIKRSASSTGGRAP